MHMKKLISKQILKPGKWVHPQAPNGKLEITKQKLRQLKDNFEKVYNTVPVLRSHVDNSDAEKNPDLIINKNIKKLDLKDDGLYALFEIEEKDLEKYNDVSAGLTTNYIDKETGREVGPVLKHVALVLSPYIKKLNPFTELSERDDSYLISLSDIMADKKSKKTEDKVVKASEEEATEVESTEVEESNEVETKKKSVKKDKSAKSDENEDSKTEKATEDKKSDEAEKVEESKDSEDSNEAEVQASDETAELKDRIIELEEQLANEKAEKAESKAKSKFQALLSEGKVVPAQKEKVIQLYELAYKQSPVIELSDEKQIKLSSVLNKFFKSSPKLVNLSEKGADAEDTKPKSDTEKLVDILKESPKHKDKSSKELKAYAKKNFDKLSKHL